MPRLPGQPQTPAFELVKTQYWFNYVKNLIRTEMLEACEMQLRGLETSKVDKAIYRKELRAVKNNLKRLQDKSKNGGPKFSEMQKHLEKKELESGISSLFDEEGTGKFSGKVWGRYASGTYTPSRILDDLVVFYPDSKVAYENGPNNLFAILEAETLEEAYLLIKDTFISALRTCRYDFIACDVYDFVDISDIDSNEIEDINYICDKKIKMEDERVKLQFIYERFLELENLFLDLRHNMSKEGRDTWGYMCCLRTFRTLNIEDAATLLLSFTYTSYKFLGYKGRMYANPHGGTIFEALEVYGIDRDTWLNPKGRCDRGVLAVISKVYSLVD